MRAAVLLVLLSGCGLYFGGDDAASGEDPPIVFPTGGGRFTKTRSIAGEYPIVGVDSDHGGGLWVAYQIRNGDYYSPDETRVVHLDGAGAKDREFVYTDEYTNVSGIAFAGGALWLNYGNWDAGSGNLHLRELDPVTGAKITSYGMPNGIIDVDAYANELRLSYQWNEVIAIDRDTGGELWRFDHTLFDGGGTQRGIASTQYGDIWVASWISDEIYLLDGTDHHVKAHGTTDLLDHDPNIDSGVQLAWDGTQLILAIDGQINWLTYHGD